MTLSVDRAREFLATRRIAVAGVSRDEKDFSRYLFGELVARGYDAVPVNPALAEVDGRRAFASLADIEPPVEAALILTPRSATEGVVADALRAGIRRIWLHRGAGAGSATAGALALCRASGVEPVHDLCPFMVLTGTAFPHRFHGFFRRHLAHEHPAPQA
ncbi:CoA-binding domain protein [Anaeromyxobacter sp. K]|uniref:CoA-binding protein n=1 Tax=Anaeromyxobacter sp. (strain K) TaxID=447217 RepID=UPI00015F8C7F|nr:CoA-binding protein [Anaeromyxobacter sp. K]ACG72287.1 CoA-binding domain protein [Anaeromyxobacter sp. K]